MSGGIYPLLRSNSVSLFRFSLFGESDGWSGIYQCDQPMEREERKGLPDTLISSTGWSDVSFPSCDGSSALCFFTDFWDFMAKGLGRVLIGRYGCNGSWVGSL